MAFIKEPGWGKELTCPWCGYQGSFQKKHLDFMSLMIFIGLLTFFIFPGVFYALWHSNQEECPECRASVPRGPF